MDSLRGQLLIAPPYLTDPNFARTVVLVIEHDEEGAFGVILNRRSGRTIREVWQELRGGPCRCDQAVNLGGPVTGPLVALHTEPALGDKVVDGVWCTLSAEKIEEIVGGERSYVRFYAGYSGWGSGQLEGELQTGSWLTTTATADTVFGTREEDLWARVVRRVAGGETLPPLDLGGGEPDPSMN